ncbi:ABC-2 type transport system permease protein [Rhodococcus sp. 27YEA15]|uniref:ABC transporter permease n=1 Tax=Rhodococcus sp. 27YEA15 TaxID=3156259 RepID=UPI003C7AC436
MTTLVRAEIEKVLTLRYWWALGIAPVAVALIAAALTRPIVGAVADGSGATFDVTLASAGIGLGVSNALVSIFAAVFGAVTAGSEFAHRTLPTTFVTARSRDAVLAAKLGTIAVFAVGYALVVEIAGIGSMMLFSKDFTFTADLFAISGAGILACVAWALLGAGAGLLTGSPTAGSLAVVLWFTLGEWLIRAVLSVVDQNQLGTALPVSAAVGTVVNAAPSIDLGGFAPWPAAPMILVVWAVAVCGSGWLRTRTRDIR